MGKELSEMTLEELWELFPIYLTEHKTEWHTWYEEERIRLQSCLPMSDIVRISHIGSTAINKIWAKPIIDILIEIKPGCGFKHISNAIQHAGYTLMSSDEKRISFNKGYTSSGFEEKVFHLHVRCENDNDEIYFRDYLNANPDIAYEYQKLKLKLWPEFVHDRNGYTDRKSDFVKFYTEKAKFCAAGER